MRAKTLIALAVMVVLAMMVLPALAQSRLLTASTASSAAAINLPVPANLPNAALGSSDAKPIDPNGIDRLINATGGSIRVSVSRATGAVRFITVSPDKPGALSALVGANKTPQQQSEAFFAAYGSLFGITDAKTQLKWVDSQTDSFGTTRVEYRQMYKGVPVFAGIMLVHFNAKGQMTAVNGVFVPDIAVDATPKLTPAEANAIAVNAVGPTGISARKTTLYVYRTGLAQGVVGSSYLVYEVEATNGVTVRDFVYVEAHTGKIVDRVSALDNALTRRVYSGTYTTTALIWQEGAPFPFTGVYSADINSIISTTGETYNLFMSAFGRDSYNALGHVMETVNNDPRISCPNANWNGITTNYCTGVTGDDTVAHEWGHAYTEYTDNLIYAWQPGALNESYSDIWGEVVDLLNGRGKDVPGGLRTDGACSVFTSFPPTLTVNTPAYIAGGYPVAGASFGPAITTSITNTVIIADDGIGQPGPGVDGTVPTSGDACTPLINGAQIVGHIALVNRGTCNFDVKVQNAENAGAIAVIVTNHAAGGNTLVNMSGALPVTIPAVFVGYGTGVTIRSGITDTVSVTIRPDSVSGVTDNSYRWLSGEDDPAFGEAIRDLWNPACYNNPNKVVDPNYMCGTDDGGGVHSNSGVPNHAFALLVDGGHFNGYTITGISMTKAAHLYYRAQSVYQVPTTDFTDHADALLASCNDLVNAGTNLPALSVFVTNTVLSGQVFTTTDCLQVQKVISATEMRVDPTAQCNFQPLLNPNAPALCAAGTGTPVSIFNDTFEVASGWTVTHTDVYSPTNLEWVRRSSLPGGHTGFAFYGIDEVAGSQCSGDIGDVSRVMRLTSPLITLPPTITINRVAFDHYVATEITVDGGNLKISVNGGAWQIVNTADFTFNPYNGVLLTAAAGNTNPLAGESAFTGSDGGLVTGSWGRTMVDIHKYAKPGDTIQLRFELGTDGCGGLDGWYVDNVQVYYCSADVIPTINKTGPAHAFIGNVVPYTIVAQAPSSGLARLTDTLPSGVTFAGGLTASSGYVVYSSTTRSIYWSNQPLPMELASTAVNHSEHRTVELKLDARPMVTLGDPDIPAPANVPLAVGDPVTLTLDDGTAENSIGINDTTYAYQFIWLNRFTPAPTAFPFQLNQIRVLFPSTGGVSVGNAIDLVIYSDPDGNPANGATLRGVFSGTVQAADNTTWSVYNLPSPVTLSGPGDVLIGVIDRFVNSGVTLLNYPAAVDTTTSAVRSWVGWWNNDPPSPPILPPDATFATIDSLGLPGNWTVRGYGEVIAAPPPVITITFNVTVTTAPVGGVTNIANMTWDGIPLQSAHTFRAPAEIYLPLIRK